MQQFLCKPEGRLGSQTTSVSRPDVFVRRNGFIPHYGQEHQRRRAQHSMSYYVKLCLLEFGSHASLLEKTLIGKS